jgi:hypothetical protein
MISLDQVKIILGEFLDTQVLNHSENSFFKWVVRGSVVLYLNNLENNLSVYKPLLINLGILDQDLWVNPEAVKTFLDNAFKAEPTLKLNLFGSTISFTKEDGDALIALMEKYNGS